MNEVQILVTMTLNVYKQFNENIFNFVWHKNTRVLQFVTVVCWFMWQCKYK